MSPVQDHGDHVGSPVRTMVEHYSGDSRDQGTRTVTRTITPTGEMSVYASQSSVRFRMTSKSDTGRHVNMTLPRQQTRDSRVSIDSDDGARDLYPSVTTLRRTSTPARSVSLREDNLRTSQQCLPSPNFNIVHRDTERSGEDDYRESSTAPQQGYSVVVAIDFGEKIAIK